MLEISKALPHLSKTCANKCEHVWYRFLSFVSKLKRPKAEERDVSQRHSEARGE